MRERIERAFEAWGHVVYRRAWVIIALCLAAAGGLITQLPRLELDTSTESFLKKNDPIRLTYDAFREQFGTDQRVLIAIEPPEVFDLDFLKRLRAFHQDLEDEVPKLQEVSSLINARDTRGEGDQLIVEDLLEDWPASEEALARVRERALANPLYRDQLLDREARLTTVVLEFDTYSSLDAPDDTLAGFDDSAAPAAEAPRPFLTGEENSAVVLAIEEVVQRYEAPDFRIHMAGVPIMMHEFQVWMVRDMSKFTLLAVATIGLFLAVLFRRVVGVALPLLVAVLSVGTTFGLIAALGYAIMLPQQILPSFLLAVSVGGTVHLLVIFFQHLARGNSRRDAIAHALGHSGLAIVMTSLTTAGGLSSFVAAELAPIAQLGITAPLGVLIALIFTLLLVPALLAVFPLRADRGETQAGRRTRSALVAVGDLATRHALAVALIWVGLLGASALGAAQLRFSHQPLLWFPEETPFRQATELMNDRMRGSMYMEVLVDSGAENGLHEPELLNRLDEMRRWAGGVQRGDIYVGKTVSIVDVVKEIHQALNENRADFHTIPQDRQLVAQELLLFENSGSDDLADVVDSQFRVARFNMKLPFEDAIQYAPFMDTVEENFARILGDQASFRLTGLMAIMARTFTAVMHSMAWSYVIAFLVITPLMVLLIGNVRVGMLSMIPNLAPILITLGVMGWLGLPLDAFTLMIGGIAIGLAVDDTIHFMHNFRRYYERSGDVRDAVRQTLSTTGQAMLFTSLVLSTGFFIYALATLRNLVTFGLLTGFTIIVAFLADALLAPALMALVVGRERVAAPASVTEEVA
jgi:hypothetical protein